VIIFGGVSSGGYQRAINLMTLVDVQYNEEEEKEQKVEAKEQKKEEEEEEEEVRKDVEKTTGREEGCAVGAVSGFNSRERLDDVEGCSFVGSDFTGDVQEQTFVENSGGYVEDYDEEEDDDDSDDDGSDDDEDEDDDSDDDEEEEMDEDEEMWGEEEEEGWVEEEEDSDDERPFVLEVTLKVVRPAPVISSHQSLPTSRGYHSASAVLICSQDYLLVWGGLGNKFVVHTDGDQEGGDHGGAYVGSKTLTHLELLNCSSLRWHTEISHSGTEPSSRFGHSCTFHPRTNSLIFMGGSDGTDLLRNGQELREVG
jgi:hypothetical protein